MDEKKYKLICVRKGKTNYARTNNRKNVTLGSYIDVHPKVGLGIRQLIAVCRAHRTATKHCLNRFTDWI